MNFSKSEEYNDVDGSWWLTSSNLGPIKIVIKVEGRKELSSKIADKICEFLNVDEEVPERAEVFVKLSFDLDQMTVGSEEEQKAAVIEQINLVLQREPYGLGANISEVEEKT